MQSSSRRILPCLAVLVCAGITPSPARAGQRAGIDACATAVKTVPTIDGNVDGLKNNAAPDPFWTPIPTIVATSTGGHKMTLQFASTWPNALYISGIVDNVSVQVKGGNPPDQIFDTLVIGIGSAGDYWRFVVQPFVDGEKNVPYYYGDNSGITSSLARLVLVNDPATPPKGPASVFWADETSPTSTGWTTGVTNGAQFGSWLDPGPAAQSPNPRFAFGATDSRFEFEIFIPALYGTPLQSSIQDGIRFAYEFLAYVNFIATDGVGNITDQYAWPPTATIATSTGQGVNTNLTDDKQAIPWVDKWASMVFGGSCPPLSLNVTPDDIGAKPLDANGYPDPHLKIPAATAADCANPSTTPGKENDLVAHLHNNTSASLPSVTVNFSWAAWGITGNLSGWQDAGTQTLFDAAPHSPVLFGDSTNIPVFFTQSQACQFQLADPLAIDPHPCLQATFTTAASNPVSFDSNLPVPPNLPPGTIGAYVQKNMIWSTTQSPLLDQALIDTHGFPPPPAGSAQQSFLLTVDQQLFPQTADDTAFKTHPPSPCSPADPNGGSAACCAQQSAAGLPLNARCGQPAPTKWETLEYAVRAQRMTGNTLTIKGKPFRVGEAAGMFGVDARHFYTPEEALAPPGTVKWGSQLAPVSGARLTPIRVNTKVGVVGRGEIGQELYRLDVPVNATAGIYTNLIGGADATQPPPPPSAGGPGTIRCNCRGTQDAALPGLGVAGAAGAGASLLLLLRRRRRRA